MRLLFFVILTIFYNSCFSQDSVSLPINLKFGMTLNEYKQILEKQSFKDGADNFMYINQYENYSKEYKLNYYTYSTCQLIGTLKPAIFSGFFSKDKLAVVGISFSTSTKYSELKKILVDKYNLPTKDTTENLNVGGACYVTEWKIQNKIIRLYGNLYEADNPPNLEYIDMTLLTQIKKENEKLNRNSYW